MTSIEKFSHILLRNIISFLDNIDRICFVFTCKSLYIEREKYIEFNLKEGWEVNSKYTLPLFKDLILEIFKSFPVKKSHYFEKNEIVKKGSIPDDTVNLTFAPLFNSKIEPYSIPKSVKVINLGYMFNQKLELNTFQDGLEIIMFSKVFNQSLTVTETKSIDNNYNDNSSQQQVIKKILPDSLHTLLITDIQTPVLSNVNALPSSLTELFFPYGLSNPLTPGMIPPTVRVLSILGEYKFNLAVGDLPASNNLVDLTISPVNTILAGVIPSSVKTLKLPHYRRPLLVGTVPPSVTSLDLGDVYDIPLVEHVIPPSVKTLKIGIRFSRQVNSVLPDSITELWYLGNGSIIPEFLPPKLKSLTIRYPNKGVLCRLPKSVESLEFIYLTQGTIDTAVTMSQIYKPPSHIRRLTFSFSEECKSSKIFNQDLISVPTIVVRDPEAEYTLKKLDDNHTIVLNTLLEGFIVPTNQLIEKDTFIHVKLMKTWIG